ncbi:MAG: hypothetical protein ABFD92_02050 [Planctomycetaceae bacterium]|nr:hypothetical protein [Planctomycetaceae bacterium]
MKYCKICNRNVEPRRSWTILDLLLFLVIVPAVVGLFIWIPIIGWIIGAAAGPLFIAIASAAKNERCPICHGNCWSPPRSLQKDVPVAVEVAPPLIDYDERGRPRPPVQRLAAGAALNRT